MPLVMARALDGIHGEQHGLGGDPGPRFLAAQLRQRHGLRVPALRHLELAELDASHRAVVIDAHDPRAGHEIHADSDGVAMQRVDNLLPSFIDINHPAPGDLQLSDGHCGALLILPPSTWSVGRTPRR